MRLEQVGYVTNTCVALHITVGFVRLFLCLIELLMGECAVLTVSIQNYLPVGNDHALFLITKSSK